MGEQLAIPVEVVNPDGYQKAKEEYDTDVKKRDLWPVFLILNTIDKTYFVSRYWSREWIEATYKHFKIVE